MALISYRPGQSVVLPDLASVHALGGPPAWSPAKRGLPGASPGPDTNLSAKLYVRTQFGIRSPR